MSQDQSIPMEKSVNNLGGPIVEWDKVSRDLQGGANSVSQVHGVSNMAPTCQLCGSVKGGLRKGTLASTCCTVWEKAVHSSCLDVRHFSFSLYATGSFQSATRVLELRVSESE